MRFCESHWGRLKRAVESETALKPLILPTTTRDSAAAVIHEALHAAIDEDWSVQVEYLDRRAKATPCPLLEAHNLVVINVMTETGLGYVTFDSPCPVCNAVHHFQEKHSRSEIEYFLSKGPVKVVLEQFKDRGLIPSA